MADPLFRPPPPSAWALARATSRLMALALALALALAVPAAHAARPLATEDAGVLAPHDCEWESVAIAARSRGTAAGWALSNQIGCGVGLRSQLALARVVSGADGAGNPAWQLGGKTELLAGDEQPLSLALAYGASQDRPAGGHGHQPGARSLSLVGSYSPADGWTTHANIGWVRDPAAKVNGLTWNLALEGRLGEGVDVGAEWFGQQHASPQWGLGLRYTPSHRWSFNLGLAASTDAGQARSGSAGLTLAF